MYLIQESNKVYDMHLRKKYNDIRLKKILITTYDNKYYFSSFSTQTSSSFLRNIVVFFGVDNILPVGFIMKKQL